CRAAQSRSCIRQGLTAWRLRRQANYFEPSIHRQTRSKHFHRLSCAAVGADAPAPAPYPVQRGLTTPMRLEAQKAGDVQRMQAWAGQSAALARAESASVITERVWSQAQALLRETVIERH